MLLSCRCANGEAYARAMFNLCWTETHARTIVGRSYVDSDFHDNVRAIFSHVKDERADDYPDIITQASEAATRECAVFLQERQPHDADDNDDAPARPTFRKNAACLNDFI